MIYLSLLGEKEAANRSGFGETVAPRRIWFGCSKCERLRKLKEACSRTILTSGADIAARGASPSMRERGLTYCYHASIQMQVEKNTYSTKTTRNLSDDKSNDRNQKQAAEKHVRPRKKSSLLRDRLSIQRTDLENERTLLTLDSVRKAVALATRASGNRHLILLSHSRLFDTFTRSSRSWPKEIFRLHRVRLACIRRLRACCFR